MSEKPTGEQALKQRVEDLEDLRDLESAIEENQDKPLQSWADAKQDLGL